jgi:hypothetical protein
VLGCRLGRTSTRAKVKNREDVESVRKSGRLNVFAPIRNVGIEAETNYAVDRRGSPGARFELSAGIGRFRIATQCSKTDHSGGLLVIIGWKTETAELPVSSAERHLGRLGNRDCDILGQVAFGGVLRADGYANGCV